MPGATRFHSVDPTHRPHGARALAAVRRENGGSDRTVHLHAWHAVGVCWGPTKNKPKGTEGRTKLRSHAKCAKRGRLPAGAERAQRQRRRTLQEDLPSASAPAAKAPRRRLRGAQALPAWPGPQADWQHRPKPRRLSTVGWETQAPATTARPHLENHAAGGCGAVGSRGVAWGEGQDKCSLRGLGSDSASNFLVTWKGGYLSKRNIKHR